MRAIALTLGEPAFQDDVVMTPCYDVLWVFALRSYQETHSAISSGDNRLASEFHKGFHLAILSIFYGVIFLPCRAHVLGMAYM